MTREEVEQVIEKLIRDQGRTAGAGERGVDMSKVVDFIMEREAEHASVVQRARSLAKNAEAALAGLNRVRRILEG